MDTIDPDLPRQRRQQLAWQRRRILRLADSGRDLTVPPEELLEALGAVVAFDAWCAGAVDPVTLVPTRSWGNALPPDRAIALDYQQQDPFSLRELAAANPPVWRLSDALGIDGQVGLAAKHRELLAAHGYAHELRAVLVSDHDAWGFLHLFRRPDRPNFDPVELGFVADLAPQLAGALRRWMLAAPEPAGDQPLPGVLVLDPGNQLESASPQAEAWLAELGCAGPDRVLPAVVYGVASLALLEPQPPRPARARLRLPAGTWLQVHGTRLHGRDGQARVAVVLEPARPEQVAPVIARAAGLSPREREVAMLVLQGRSTGEIAEQLFISPYTVQDHVTAIFDKVGVRSRRDLAGEVFGIGRA